MNVFMGRSITRRCIDQNTAFSGISFTMIKQLFECPGVLSSVLCPLFCNLSALRAVEHTVQRSAVLGTMHCSSAKPGLQNREAETLFFLLLFSC